MGWGCAASWRLLPAGISSNQISGPSLLSFFLRHIYELLPRHPTGVSKPNPSFPPNLACSSITRCHPDERQPRSYKRNLEIIPDPSPCCPSQPRQYSQFELLLQGRIVNGLTINLPRIYQERLFRDCPYSLVLRVRAAPILPARSPGPAQWDLGAGGGT